MLQINYMHFRRDFYPLMVHLLNQVNRQFKLNFLTDNSFNVYDIADFLDKNAKFDYEIVVFGRHGNYQPKICWAAKKCEDYFCKLDEDIFIPPRAWEFIIDNLGELDKNNRLFFSPWLLNGVPTGDEAAKFFLSEEEYAEYSKLCLSTLIDSYGCTICPGCSEEFHEGYLALNKHTIGAKEWNPKAFYKEAWNIKHYWRGISPARINFCVTEFLNNWVLNNSDKFYIPQDYEVYDTFEYPYLANSIYFTNKKNIDIIANLVKETGDFDEAPMARYRIENNMPMTFVSKVCGIHTLYSNACGPKHENINSNPDGLMWELEYYTKLNERLRQ